MKSQENLLPFFHFISFFDGDELSVNIDYSATLSEMISAGDYADINKAINQKFFPALDKYREIKKKTSIQVALFSFNYPVTSDMVIAEMHKNNYRPAVLAELLALGASFPGLQLRFTIIALGSVWRRAEKRAVPVIGYASGKRFLNLYIYDSKWSEVSNFCFLAVRDEKK